MQNLNENTLMQEMGIDEMKGINGGIIISPLADRLSPLKYYRKFLMQLQTNK